MRIQFFSVYIRHAVFFNSLLWLHYKEKISVMSMRTCEDYASLNTKMQIYIQSCMLYNRKTESSIAIVYRLRLLSKISWRVKSLLVEFFFSTPPYQSWFQYQELNFFQEKYR